MISARPAPRRPEAGNATLLAIDPGHKESAYVVYDRNSGKPERFGKVPNGEMLRIIASAFMPVVIEQVACMGMAVGAEVFETVFWSGRFAQACEENSPYVFQRVKRHEVKQHLCQNQRAKDANIRQALIDRYGPGRELAIGRKANPGPLYGVSNDVWAALAVAVTFADRVSVAPSGASPVAGVKQP